MRVETLLGLAIAACAACDETPATPSAQPATLSQVVLAPASVVAGATSTGTLTLSGPTSADAVEIRLSSSDGAAVVPASITVPAGAAVAAFTVTTRLVAADTNATISAVLGGEQRDAVLRVLSPIARPPTLQGLAVDPAVLKGGVNTQGTIQLTGPALAPMTIAIRSNNPLATPPPTVTVLTGATSAPFPILTRPVMLDTIFDITATLADQSRSAQIRLTP
jgi:hypothetical protein